MAELRELNWSELVHFNDKQKEAEQLVKKYKYLLYGGAMGGGKSYWLRWMLVKLLIVLFEKYKLKGIRCGLFCEDYPALKDRHISKINYEFPSWLGQLNKGDNEYVLNGVYGSGVIAFRNLDDASKYASSEFAVIGVDELTKNNKEVFDMLRTRLRWAGISETKFIAGTNPGGIGHGWVKKMFLDKSFEKTEKEAEQFCYIRATAHDNSANLSSTYFDQLEGLPEQKRKAFLMGDWNLFEGQFFSEWSDDIHVVAPYSVPVSFRRFGAYDHGRAKPACFKWYGMDYDGNIVCYRELYVNKEDGSDRWEADKIAREVVRITSQANEVLEYVVADSAIFTKTGVGETIAEVMKKNGVGIGSGCISVLIPSMKDRISGWTLMHQYLYHDDVTKPKLTYFSTCVDSIRTIPSLVYDEHKFEDLDSDGEDHCADVDRYFLQTIRSKKTAFPMTSAERAEIAFKKKIGLVKDNAGIGAERWNV